MSYPQQLVLRCGNIRTWRFGLWKLLIHLRFWLWLNLPLLILVSSQVIVVCQQSEKDLVLLLLALVGRVVEPDEQDPELVPAVEVVSDP